MVDLFCFKRYTVSIVYINDIDIIHEMSHNNSTNTLPRPSATRWRLRLLLLLARQSSSKHGFALARSSNLKEGELYFQQFNKKSYLCKSIKESRL